MEMKENTLGKTFTIPSSIMLKLSEYSAKKQIPMSVVVTQALKDFFYDLGTADEVKIITCMVCGCRYSEKFGGCPKCKDKENQKTINEIEEHDRQIKAAEEQKRLILEKEAAEVEKQKKLNEINNELNAAESTLYRVYDEPESESKTEKLDKIMARKRELIEQRDGLINEN